MGGVRIPEFEPLRSQLRTRMTIPKDDTSMLRRNDSLRAHTHHAYDERIVHQPPCLGFYHFRISFSQIYPMQPAEFPYILQDPYLLQSEHMYPIQRKR